MTDQQIKLMQAKADASRSAAQAATEVARTVASFIPGVRLVTDLISSIRGQNVSSSAQRYVGERSAESKLEAERIKGRYSLWKSLMDNTTKLAVSAKDTALRGGKGGLLK